MVLLITIPREPQSARGRRNDNNLWVEKPKQRAAPKFFVGEQICEDQVVNRIERAFEERPQRKENE